MFLLLLISSLFKEEETNSRIIGHECIDKINYTCKKPHVFIAKTVKAKDVVGGENNVAYHFWKPSPEQIQQTVDYLNQKANKLQKAMEA